MPKIHGRGKELLPEMFIIRNGGGTILGSVKNKEEAIRLTLEHNVALRNETPASTDPVANRETADVINAARVMCEQYQLLCSIVSEIAAFKDVDWEQDEHEKAIQRFSRALAKLDVPLTSAPSQSSTLTEGKEENL